MCQVGNFTLATLRGYGLDFEFECGAIEADLKLQKEVRFQAGGCCNAARVVDVAKHQIRPEMGQCHSFLLVSRTHHLLIVLVKV